jgi:hypothetical protein
MLSGKNVIGKDLRNPGNGVYAIFPPPGMASFNVMRVERKSPECRGWFRTTWGCSNYVKTSLAQEVIEIRQFNSYPMVMLELFEANPEDEWYLSVYDENANKAKMNIVNVAPVTKFTAAVETAEGVAVAPPPVVPQPVEQRPTPLPRNTNRNLQPKPCGCGQKAQMPSRRSA